MDDDQQQSYRYQSGQLVCRRTILNDCRRAKGIPIIIGAQVGKRSMLTRSSRTVASQYRDILVAQEGAFGAYLLKHDITDTPLMCAAGGKLAPQSISGQPGLSLTLTPST